MHDFVPPRSYDWKNLKGEWVCGACGFSEDTRQHQECGAEPSRSGVLKASEDLSMYIKHKN